MATVVRPPHAYVPARGGRAHCLEARLQKLRPVVGAGRLAHGGQNPVRHRALRIRANAEGHILIGATGATSGSPTLRPSRTRARDRSGLRPASQDVAAKPEATRDQSHSAARKYRYRPDGARRGYSGRRFCRTRRRTSRMTRMIRQSMTAYAAPLCETVVEAPEPR